MKPEDRTKLQRILASFDEAGLVALANKGLVRRAQKDLEAGGLEYEETEDAVLVRGPGWTVTMPADGPTRATDTTKATGVTRQILTATIYLRDQWAFAPSGDAPPTEAEPAPASTEVETLTQALLGVTVEDLQKWAGKTTVKEVFALLGSSLDVEVETHAGLTLRLTRHDVEARLLPFRSGRSSAKLLDQVLTTAPRSQHSRWVVAAVLAFQRSRGLQPRLPEESATTEAAGAPVSQRQVLETTQELLESMVATGLAHPSERMLQRLFTLSVSATAVHLPRLARALRALADDVTQVLTRHAAADTGRLFERLCRTHTLAKALLQAGPTPPRGLVGFHRTEYDPAGDLPLAGVGAYPWQTASGYEGVTVLFWDRAGKRFLTWSASRPVASPGRFSMETAYRVESVWAGGGSPERLSRSRFTLRQAKTNALGRLSGSQQSSVVEPTPTNPDDLDFGDRLFTDWQALADYALTTYPLGLAERNPLDRVVILRPAAWGERTFDELQQSFRWQLEDAEGRALALTLPWNGVNEASVEFLEAVKPDRDALTGALVRIGFGPQGLTFEPLALLGRGTPSGQGVLNPGFDRGLITSRHSSLLERLRKKFGRDRIPTALTADDEWQEEAGGLGLERLPPGLRTSLGEVDALLLRLAEAGLRRVDEGAFQRLGQLAADLGRAGFAELADALDDSSKNRPNAPRLLWIGYLCQLYREALALRASQ